MSRKKMFKEDLSRSSAINETMVLVINEAADLSAEYYRRWQLEGNPEDLELSNRWRDVVTELKAIEKKTCVDSSLCSMMSQRVGDEPGKLKSLLGFRGKSEKKAIRGKEPEAYSLDGSKEEGAAA
mgnify:CR=1 FL=1